MNLLVSNSFKNNAAKYRSFGTILNRNRRNSERNRRAATDENAEMVQALLDNNSNVSKWRNGTDLFVSSFNRITRNELKRYTYQSRAGHQ